LKNSAKSSFLGDAHFPRSIESRYKDGKINHFIALYERYSSLSFTYVSDRPIALAGIEAALLRSLATTGAYAVLEAYLHRTLLWRRAGAQEPMSRVFRLGHGSRPPSWSWMSWDGRIEYMKVPYGKVGWNPEIKSPFRGFEGMTQGPEGRLFELVVPARDLSAQGRQALREEGPGVWFDGEAGLEDRIRVVEVGRERRSANGSTGSGQKLYVFLVAPLEIIDEDEMEEEMLYQRVGAGILEREFVVEGHKMVRVR
jgi:hypothetical protein